MKLKKLIPTVVLLLLSFCFSFPGVAQVIPNTTPTPIIGGGSSGGGSTIESLPIGSIAELKAWALEQSRHIHSGVWAITSTTTGTNTVTSYSRVLSNGLDVIEDLKYVNNLQFTMNIHNLQDRIEFHSSIEDSEGWSLFYGNGSSRIFLISGKYVTDHVRLDLRMSEYVPIPVENAQWAAIRERDENGNVISYYNVSVFNSGNYETSKSRLYFPAYFAGRSGELVVGFKDGSEKFFELQNGKKLPTQRVVGQLSVQVPGVIGLRDTNAVYIAVSREDYRENRGTTVQLTLTQATAVAFASWLPGTNEEMAYAVRIRASGSSKTQEYKIIEPTYYVPVALDAGRYYITFRFRSGFGKDEYIRPYILEGKG